MDKVDLITERIQAIIGVPEGNVEVFGQGGVPVVGHVSTPAAASLQGGPYPLRQRQERQIFLKATVRPTPKIPKQPATPIPEKLRSC